MGKKRKAKLSQREVRHIAGLAKLPLSEKEIVKFQKQLSDILDYIDILNELKTEKASPTSQVTDLENVTREDKPGVSLSQEKALSGGQKVHKSFFKAKGVFEK